MRVETPTLPVTFDSDLHQLGHFLNPVSSPKTTCDHLERRACVNQLQPEPAAGWRRTAARFHGGSERGSCVRQRLDGV